MGFRRASVIVVLAFIGCGGGSAATIENSGGAAGEPTAPSAEPQVTRDADGWVSCGCGENDLTADTCPADRSFGPLSPRCIQDHGQTLVCGCGDENPCGNPCGVGAVDGPTGEPFSDPAGGDPCGDPCAP